MLVFLLVYVIKIENDIIVIHYTDDWYLILRAEKSSHPTCPVLANVANRMNDDAICSSPKYRPYKSPQEDNSFRVF